MNNKSRNIRAVCGASTLGNLSDNKQFLRDHYKMVKHHLDDDFSDKVSKALSVEELQILAEEEFIHFYDSYPTCAVFAPGSLALAGKSTDGIESKSLSMAVQLVTLIVGKRIHGSKWCHVKTLSEEIDGEKTVRFYLNQENLDVSTEKTTWVRYLKATMQTFKAKRASLPGFEIVIISTVPVKRGLGSSSALVVALYTFLEAITNLYMGNVLEKTLACHLAEKLAAGFRGVHLVDTLASVVGKKDTIIGFDVPYLSIDQCDWDPMKVEMILIEYANVNGEKPTEFPRDVTRYKEVMTVMNTMARWRTNPTGTTMLKLLFSERTISMAENIVNEDNMLSKMLNLIKMEEWEKLGELLWENYHSARKYLNSLSDDCERIMNLLKTTKGVLGANVIGCGASIIALVQRSRLKTLICLLNRMKISQQRCYTINSSSGASVLYTYERIVPWYSARYRYPAKLVTKYHLRDDHDSETSDQSTVDYTRALSMIMPHTSALLH